MPNILDNFHKILNRRFTWNMDVLSNIYQIMAIKSTIIQSTSGSVQHKKQTCKRRDVILPRTSWQ